MKQENEPGIEEFLEQKQGDRETVPGVFTLASSKAADKMGRYLLPEPEMWVLKVVQAAVRAKAAQLDFKFGRNKTTVRIGGGEAWSLSDLKDCLESIDNALPSHGELLLALRSLASTHDFTLKDETGNQLQYIEEKLSSAEDGRGSSYRLQLVVKHRKQKGDFRTHSNGPQTQPKSPSHPPPHPTNNPTPSEYKIKQEPNNYHP